MKRLCLIFALCSFMGGATAQDRIPAHPHVRIETTEGAFVLELATERAPITVRNFLSLVDSGHFDGTIFHRVVPNFMIQGGGFTPNLEKREVENRIPNESGNGMSNIYGTVAMARLGDPHSASSQFFINVADNKRLDPSVDGWGYAVFGYVIQGMEVVDKIAAVRTGPAKGYQNVPVVPVVIKKAARVVYDD